MLRRQAVGIAACSAVLRAPHIPRSVWDPAHYNENWTDSYGTDIADRRQWPSKKWSVGLEPRTPSDWLQYSKRNLAYGYNGAMRACSTFPEMVELYKEMKQRDVKVDVDTMNILLTRGARYEALQVDDLFLLFDEMVGLGARPDVAAVETLHTVLDHSAGMPVEWREVRRRQLVEWYNCLAVELIERLRPNSGHQLSPLADTLLSHQMNRLRDNLRQLQASLSPHVYRQYFHVIQSSFVLMKEVQNFLWEFVQPNHPATTIPNLGRFPAVGLVMKRPPLPGSSSGNSGSSTALMPASRSAFNSQYQKHGMDQLKITDFEDSDVCAVLLAAVERVVEAGFPADPVPPTTRRLFLMLLSTIRCTGVLYTADLMAQLMDMVKYAEDDLTRDTDAQRVLQNALRGSSSGPQDEAYRRLWKSIQPVADGRVVGRYIAARHPWTMSVIHFNEQQQFRGTYPSAASLSSSSSSSGISHSSSAGEEAAGEDGGGEGAGAVVPSQQQSLHLERRRTAEAFAMRWNDVQALIKATRVLPGPSENASAARISAAMEVFTGQMVFLRTAATGHRYETLEAALATQATGGEIGSASEDSDSHGAQSAGGSAVGGATAMTLVPDLPLSVWQRILAALKDAHAGMEAFMAQYSGKSPEIASSAEPEFECWEAMLIVLRSIMDYCASARLRASNSVGAAADPYNPEAVDALFKEAAELRSRLVEDSLTRFNGRLRILWLHEV